MSSTVEEDVNPRRCKRELHLLVFSPNALLLKTFLLPKILKEDILPVRIFRLSHCSVGGETI